MIGQCTLVQIPAVEGGAVLYVGQRYQMPLAYFRGHTKTFLSGLPMKRVARSIRQAVSVTQAFRDGVTDRTATDSSGRSEREDPVPGRRTLNLGGLEIPLEEGELNRYEKFFLRSTEYGDANTVQKMIQNAKQYGLNVNCIDAMGRGVLRIAIEAEHIELLQILLSYEEIEIRDSLLHAISVENVQAVELIVQAQSDRQQRKNLKVHHIYNITNILILYSKIII